METTMEYDEDGNLKKKIDPSGETSYTYTEDGEIDTVTTVQGTWDYDYDTEGRLSKITDPFSNTRSREYDADGNVNVVKVNGETVSTYIYDTDGNLIERTDAEGNVYTFDYNADGQMIGQSDPEGAAFQYEYDANGRLSKTIDGNGNEIFREYGSDDTSSSGSACLTCENSPLEGGQGGVSERLQRIIYPTFIKEFRYDEQGRVSEEIYTLNGGETYSVTYTYDQFGRLQSTTGPDGRSTTYFYDRMGRRIRVDDPSGQTTFEYDNWDNLIALTDANNKRTEFEYDTLGRLKKEIRPMSQETTYEYYPEGSGQDAGRLWKMVDAKNQITEYGYDAQGRLETISYADGKTVTLNYDADGNLVGYSDGETSAEYGYDDLGRKIWERVNYGDFTKEFSYTFYKNGLKKTFTMPDGTMYEYAYGNNNELREVSIPGLGAITLPDDTWNRPAKMIFPGGTQRTYGYDALMRLQSLTVTDPGGNPLLDYAYTYDNIGNIVTKATEHGTYGYDYDASSRLTGVDNPVLDDESYTYDDVGNRLTSADVSGSWSYNANNELLGFADVEYTYDANGNMTQITVAGAVVWTYVYDAANRLKHVEDGTGVISADYYYDPFGRRLWKDVGGTKTYFFYSDEGLVGEYDASGNEIKTYSYKPDSTWMTDPLFLKQGTEYYFYQNDHLGTPQKLVGVNGAVVWSAQYRSFGEADVQVETVENNLRLPGQYFDEETGLHYNFQRYYNPNIGRYIQVDPVGFEGGINGFVYVENNPVRNSDPLGLWIHPHQIVSPDEALKVVNKASNVTRAYNPASEDLLDFLGVGYVDEYVQKAKDLLEAEMAAGGGEAYLLLAYLARYNWPGGVHGRDGWHNRFVFTCQHGWIDVGHFFEGAVVGYWLEKHGESRLKDPLLAVMIEEEQFDPTYFKKYPDGRIEKIPGAKFDGSKESYMTAEDVPSNFLGMQFGRDVASGAISDVADGWGYFLMKSHAVDLEKDPYLLKRLQDDANVWWGNKYRFSDLHPNDERQYPYTGPRKSWQLPEVRCQSEEYRKMCCCCSNEGSDDEIVRKKCEENIHSGACEITVPLFQYQ